MNKLLFLGLFLLLASSALAEMVTVTHQPAELRDRAMVAGSTVIRQLPRYTPLEVLSAGNAYFQVKDVDGTAGYIHKSLLEKAPAVVVTGALCNVRSGAGTEFPVVFKVRRGDSFQVTGQTQTWVQITAEDGKNGWISQNLVWGSKN